MNPPGLPANRAKRRPLIRVGDTVAYKSSFLLRAGQHLCEFRDSRGKALELLDMGDGTIMVIVAWDNLKLPGRVDMRVLTRIEDKE